MAILKHIKASVLVDDKELKEYKDEDAESTTNVVTKYVEATTGQAFSIRVEVLENYKFTSPAIESDIYIDGKCCGRSVCQKKLSKSRAEMIDIEKGIRVKDGDEWKLRPFLFSEIKTREYAISCFWGFKS